MKRIFLFILFICINFLSISVQAEDIAPKAGELIRVLSNGDPIYDGNTVTQNIIIQFISFYKTTIRVRATNNYIVKDDDPSVKIPVENLYITCGSTTQQINRGYVPIYEYTSGEIGQVPATLQLRNAEAIPEGSYHVRLQFSGGWGSMDDCFYDLSFNISPQQSIVPNEGLMIIDVEPDDVFNFDSITYTNETRELTINSNIPWKLYLDTNSMGELDGEYYIVITNVTGAVTDYPQEPVLIQRGRRYLIAEGDATYNSESSNPIPTQITLRYAYMDTDPSGYISGGQRRNPGAYFITRQTE